MAKRSRRLIAAGMAIVGLGALGYYYYSVIVLDAYVHLFEALHLGPVESSQSLMRGVLPFLGWLLLAASSRIVWGPRAKAAGRSFTPSVLILNDSSPHPELTFACREEPSG